MAFDDLFPSKPGAAQKAPLRLGMTKMRGARARMVLLVDRSVLAGLGGKAERYRMKLGRAEDKHLLMLIQDDQGPFEANLAGQKSTIMRLRLPVVEAFPDCKIAVDSAAFEVGKVQKNAIVVTLPAWAWNPEARQVRERAAARSGGA